MLDVPLERVNQHVQARADEGGHRGRPRRRAGERRTSAASTTATRRSGSWSTSPCKLEGTNRNVGTHAAGVVIANGPITDYVPVQRVARKTDGEDGDASGEAVDHDAVGDGRSSRRSACSRWTSSACAPSPSSTTRVKLIKQTRGDRHRPADAPARRHGDVRTAPARRREGRVPARNRGHPRTAEADEAGQHPRPDRRAARSTAPARSSGGMVDEYVERKHGRKKPAYPHPVMEEMLSETYGVMVYQEQIMRILNRLGGIELAKAYACIKAISKKKQEIIDAAQGRLRRRVRASAAWPPRRPRRSSS